jgi:cytidylate kinase
MTDPASTLTVTVGGLAGTGTSTLCRLLEAPLGVPYRYTGGLFREEAARRGLTLAEFNALGQQDPAVDRALDDQQLALLRAGGLLLEGRMAGWLAGEHDTGAFTVWVTCEEHERLRRIVERDGGDTAAQRAATRDRERNELERYERWYGADIVDPAGYDLVLDSTSTSPEELVAQVLAELRWAGHPVPVIA